MLVENNFKASLFFALFHFSYAKGTYSLSHDFFVISSIASRLTKSLTEI